MIILCAIRTAGFLLPVGNVRMKKWCDKHSQNENVCNERVDVNDGVAIHILCVLDFLACLLKFWVC